MSVELSQVPTHSLYINKSMIDLAQLAIVVIETVFDLTWNSLLSGSLLEGLDLCSLPHH